MGEPELKEKRRRDLQRKKEDRKRNPMAFDLATKKYRQRVRQLKELDIPKIDEGEFDE